MTPVTTVYWADRIARCEPLAFTDEATYLAASTHAAGVVPPRWNSTMESATDVMMRAIEARNQYYRDRVNDWRVVHG